MKKKINRLRTLEIICIIFEVFGAILTGFIFFSIVFGDDWVVKLVVSGVVALAFDMLRRHCDYWVDTVSNVYNSDTIMRFDDWRKIYLVNPKRWGLGSDLPFQSNDSGWTQGHRIIFSYFDWLRYKRMAARINKRKEVEDNNANIVKIIEMAQADIADLRAKANKEMSDGNELILDVIGRMK